VTRVNIVVLLIDYLTGAENWTGMGHQAFKRSWRRAFLVWRYIWIGS